MGMWGGGAGGGGGRGQPARCVSTAVAWFCNINNNNNEYSSAALLYERKVLTKTQTNKRSQLFPLLLSSIRI